MSRYNPPKLDLLKELTIVPAPPTTPPPPGTPPIPDSSGASTFRASEEGYIEKAQEYSDKQDKEQLVKVFKQDKAPVILYSFTSPTTANRKEFTLDTKMASELGQSYGSGASLVPIVGLQFESGWRIAVLIPSYTVNTDPFNVAFSSVDLTEEDATSPGVIKQRSSTDIGSDLKDKLGWPATGSNLFKSGIGYAIFPASGSKEEKSGYKGKMYTIPVDKTDVLSFVLSGIAANPPVGLGAASKNSTDVNEIIKSFKSSDGFKDTSKEVPYTDPATGKRTLLTPKFSTPLFQDIVDSSDVAEAVKQLNTMLSGVSDAIKNNKALDGTPIPNFTGASETALVSLSIMFSKFKDVGGSSPHEGRSVGSSEPSLGYPYLEGKNSDTSRSRERTYAWDLAKFIQSTGWVSVVSNDVVTTLKNMAIILADLNSDRTKFPGSPDNFCKMIFNYSTLAKLCGVSFPGMLLPQRGTDLGFMFDPKVTTLLSSSSCPIKTEATTLLSEVTSSRNNSLANFKTLVTGGVKITNTTDPKMKPFFQALGSMLKRIP